jgi:hypothetical protein
MISSKKIQFVITLIATFLFIPLLAAEPNKPNEPNKPAAELKFEIPGLFSEWMIEHDSGNGPIRPDFMAQLYIKNSSNIPGKTPYGKFDSLLQTDIGKSMSAVQKEFLNTSSSLSLSNEPSPDKPIGYVRINLYAVSQEDAKKMARAFIEYINDNAQARIKEYKDQIGKWEESISQLKKDLAEKEPQLKETEEAYKKIKEYTHKFSSDDEAVDLAKKSIIEMDKTFNDFEIELAGIHERIQAIEMYRNKSGQMPEIKVKLDSMYIDLMIELSGLEARRKVARVIYEKQQEFLNLFNKRNDLQTGVSDLKIKIADNLRNIEEATKRLNLPRPEFIPADVYKNTVTIYAVAGN